MSHLFVLAWLTTVVSGIVFTLWLVFGPGEW